MQSDPFSDILKIANTQTVVSGGFTAGGAWSIRFPAPEKIKFFGAIKGRCVLVFEDEAEPVWIDEGDVFLLSIRQPFVLASDPSVRPVDSYAIFGPGRSYATLGEGEECVQIGGYIQADPESGGLLSKALPRLIHVRAGSPHATTLRWILDQLVSERAEGGPGMRLASSQLAQLMFIHVLRAHMAASGPLRPGWLRVASDKRLAPALQLMHSEPGRSWTLEELARAVSMSRTTFAEKFKAVAGVPPLAYLTEWRMRLAASTLRELTSPISVVARSMGYNSESAFSKAFKRVVGVSPLQHRRAPDPQVSGRGSGAPPP